MKSQLHILLFMLCAVVSLADLPISKFRNTPFRVRPYSGMYRLGDLGLDITSDSQIVAYGDFNNDKYTDFVGLSDDLQTFRVYLYSYNQGNFSSFAQFTSSYPIVSIIPADYNYDGMLDLMVITPSSKSDSATLDYNILTRIDNYPYFDANNTPIKSQSTIQPFIFDATGDRFVDLLTVENGVRMVYSGGDNYNVKAFSEYVSDGVGCLNYSKVSKHTFASPHSNAFVDFNGDCAADLFITSEDKKGNLFFEIWLRNPVDNLFCLVDIVPISSNENYTISMVSLGDMNNDGRIDLVYANISTNITYPMNLHIIYNQFPTDPSTPCKIAELDDYNMTSPFNKTAYNTSFSIANTVLVTPIVSNTIPNSRLFSPDKNRPPKIRLGDVNVDGYLDVLLVVSNAEEEDPKFGNALLGINQNGDRISFPQDDSGKDITPYFQINVNDDPDIPLWNPMSSYPVLYASFFDFDEKGSLGLWFTLYDQADQSSSLMGVYNFVTSPNYILKILGLNGYFDQDDDDNIEKSLGGIYAGSSVECIVSDVKGIARIAKGAQLAQTSYTPLDLPYVFIGLGRTNSYVQDVSMGITRSVDDGDNQQSTWTPIIPNSQLIVNTRLKEAWTLDVFVNPISQTFMVVMITSLVLVVLGIVIIILHMRERNEDKKNADRMLYMFSAI